ncbi:secretory subunit [Nowakowskiella sp. JEL0407]|nr:secretory subunit [Nowakowskiella sp. JEL0407]
MGQEYNYDDSGTMFSLFLLSVSLLVLVPSTYMWLSSIISPKKSDAISQDCSCEACQKHKIKLNAKKLKKKAQIPYKEIALALGWIFVALLTYKVATAQYEEPAWDPWEILGVSEGVTDSQIRKAFRTLSLKYHPDKVDTKASDAEKEILSEKYIQIGKAYKVLTDEEARQRWEEFGHPDGKQSLTLGIALPTWLVNSSNSSLVLLVYALIFGVGLPVVVARWWYSSKNLTKDGILHPTMGRFYQELKDNITTRGLLDLLTIAEEFKEVKVDLKSPEVVKLTNAVEEKLNKTSGEHFGRTNKYGNIPWSNKVLLLIYAHLLRVPIEIPELLQEQEFVLSKCIHLTGGMAQIASARFWLGVTQQIIELNQFLVQGVYINQPANAQLPHVTPEILEHFKKGKRSIKTLSDFVEMNDSDRDLLLQKLEPKQREEALVVAKQYPVLQIKSYKFYVPNDPAITPSSLVTLRVKLGLRHVTEKPVKEDPKQDENENEDEEEKLEWWNPKPKANVLAHAPYFPETKTPVWWVLLGDKRSNRLIHLGNVKDLETEKMVKLQFQAPPKPGTVELQLFIKSDSYIGIDQMENVKFEVRPPDVLPPVPDEDDISEPEEDSIAGQMNAMRNPQKPKGAAGNEADLEDTDSEDED